LIHAPLERVGIGQDRELERGSELGRALLDLIDRIALHRHRREVAEPEGDAARARRALVGLDAARRRPRARACPWSSGAARTRSADVAHVHSHNAKSAIAASGPKPKRSPHRRPRSARSDSSGTTIGHQRLADGHRALESTRQARFSRWCALRLLREGLRDPGRHGGEREARATCEEESASIRRKGAHHFDSVRR
jgi:hypothetical protein